MLYLCDYVESNKGERGRIVAKYAEFRQIPERVVGNRAEWLLTRYPSLPGEQIQELMQQPWCELLCNEDVRVFAPISELVLAQRPFAIDNAYYGFYFRD